MNCALVGYGYWGTNLMRCFSSARNCSVEHVCEPVEARHAEIFAKYPRVKAIDTDFAATLARPEVEAVVLATPADAHFAQVRQALLAGKHVFVEKPMARTAAEARELAQLARQTGRTLMVGHTFLYNDAVLWVKRFIDQGELGEPYYAYFQRLSLGQVRQDVNALWNLAPHDVSIANFWFGETPSRVEAQGVSFLQNGIHDVNFMSMYYPSGRFAHIHVSWLDPHKTRRAVIVGGKKMVEYDDTSTDQKIVVFDKGFDRRDAAASRGPLPFGDFSEFVLAQRAGDIWIPKVSFREPLQVEAQHFVDCVAEGKAPLSDAENGLAVVEALDAATRFMAEGGND